MADYQINAGECTHNADILCYAQSCADSTMIPATSTTTSAFAKAQELQGQAAKEQSEAERLREEVLATRKARQSRIASRGGSISSMSGVGVADTPSLPSTSARTDTFQPRNTSFPVSSGINNTNDVLSGKPTSLAHLIGGSKAINGPILNKQRPHMMDGAGLETDDLNKPTETFMSKMMKHGEGLQTEGGGYARKGNGVGLPGMVRPGSAASQKNKDEQEEKQHPLMHPNALEKPKDIILPSRSPTIPTSFSVSAAAATSPAAASSASTTSDAPKTATSATPLHAPKPVKPINATAIASASAGTGSSPKPDYSSTLTSSASVSSSANNASSTPSLTRLKGSNLVKERLKWGEERASSSASSSPTSSPVPVSARSFGTAGLQSSASSPNMAGKSSFGGNASPAPSYNRPTTYSSSSSWNAASTSASANEPSPASTPKAAKRSSVLDRYNPSANAGDSVLGGTYKASYGVSPVASPKLGSGSGTASTRAPELAVGSSSSPAIGSKTDEVEGVNDGVGALSLDKDGLDDEDGRPVRRSAGFEDEDDEFAITARNRQPSSENDNKQSIDSYKASYGVGTPSRQTSSVPSLKVETQSPAAASEPVQEKDYKSSYGIKSPSISSPAQKSGSSFDKPSPAPSLSNQQKPASTSSILSSSSGNTNNKEPPAKSSSGDYKSSYGVPIARTASPLSLASVMKDAEERQDADTAKVASATDYKSSYGVASKASYSSSNSSAGFPRPSSAASNPNGAKMAGSFSSISPTSPKPSLSLPISVSPQPYQKPVSPSPTSPRSFQPSSSSYPVSLGLAPTHNKPTSLAHFIGGKQTVTGPVLNKIRPEQMDGSGLEVYMGEQDGKGLKTFLGDANLLKETAARKGKVALPGMAKSQPAASSAKSAAQASSPSYTSWNQIHGQEYDRPSPVAMPGMVRPPSPASQQQVTSPILSPASQSGRSTPSASLPLPGQASPKLPLPGQDLPAEEPQSPVSQDVRSHEQGNDLNQITGAHPSALESFSHIDSSPPSSAAPLSPSTEPPPNDPTMSRLLREGYSTTRSLESVQPSNTTSGYERPSAMTINKHILSQQEPDEVAPQGLTAAVPSSYSPFIDEGKKTMGTSKQDWQQTVKALGRPARHAPTPPAASQSTTSLGDANAEKAKLAIEAEMQSLPPVDLRIFDRPVKQTPYIKYISIDVLLLVGSSSKALTMPCDTFYSSDLLCIVLRSKHGGVVDTDLILWRGKHNLAGEAEENKVKELESRYRTRAKEVKQGWEDESLVRALGGRLVIRQGSRSTFDILNTTMYRVQSPSRGVVFVDEVELHAISLCSAFSYVASVFEELYVWHGKGSKASERAAARAYASELAQNSRHLIDMEEGREESLFRDIMGDEDYASANHWRYREHYPESIGIYSVQAASREPIVSLAGHTASTLPSDSILLLDLPFEIYLLLPAEIDRGSVIMALKVSEDLASHRHRTGVTPFRPPLHFLRLPSVLPLDLKACFRSTALDDLCFSRRTVEMRVLDDREICEYLQSLL